MSDVTVLGAGPAGLATALLLARAGHECTVVEAASTVGGMAGSFDVAGQRVDFGSHRLHPASPPFVVSLLTELLGEDLQRRIRMGRLDFGGRWVGFPLRARDLMRSLPPTVTGRLAADSIKATTQRFGHRLSGGPRLSSESAPTSFANEIAARFGPTVLEQFYGPYAQKLYGVAPEALDADLAERRVSAASAFDIARRLVRAGRPEGRTFLYPRCGYGQIADSLAEAAVAAGATIRLSAPVTRVDVRADRVRVASGDRSIESGMVFSTLPLTTLGAVLRPVPPPSVTEALQRALTRSMVLVYLVLDQPQYSPFDAHYLPALNTTVARLSEPKNYRTANDPSDRTVLCAEIACWRGDQIWRATDQALGELVAEDLERVGLPPVHHAGCEVRRLPSVYPVLDLASADARAVIADWLPRSGRLVSTGRQGLLGLDNLHHAMIMGAAVPRVLGSGGEFDSERWQDYLDAFARHTVED